MFLIDELININLRMMEGYIKFFLFPMAKMPMERLLFTRTQILIRRNQFASWGYMTMFRDIRNQGLGVAMTGCAHTTYKIVYKVYRT